MEFFFLAGLSDVGRCVSLFPLLFHHCVVLAPGCALDVICGEAAQRSGAPRVLSWERPADLTLRTCVLLTPHDGSFWESIVRASMTII
jgi:hypothetical protein